MQALQVQVVVVQSSCGFDSVRYKYDLHNGMASDRYAEHACGDHQLTRDRLHLGSLPSPAACHIKHLLQNTSEPGETFET